MKIEEYPAAGTADAGCRHADLAGMFYPKAAEELKALLDALFSSTVTSVTSPYGVLVPHAGYIYSGRCAACAYAKIPETFSGTFVVIGPSHAGCITATADLVWETPLGPVLPDELLAAALTAVGIPNRPDLLRVQENSLEVQMPFIRYRFPQAKVVPVLLGDQSPAEVRRVAAALAQAIDVVHADVVIIASGDGSHYVPAAVAERDDLTVLAAAAKLDVQAFYEKLIEIKPSMCGYGCIAVLMLVAKQLGAREAKVIMYQTSGDATGDSREVVGYAAMEVV
ncbi:AmmeMemoRadiSam system protein B [Methanocorpusculum sp. MG]|uniref:MEMO1 family protein O0S10_05290 n=1 Tax=Methanocorpusculum petauri TaxID=3002863 RepID=A0ABT4IH12_9EURY|nr:AmmeMemoRadiSam system protein B [Methanocorpusculum petauri]MCZ0860644.1 AmmeMemoRadiSam system protein B [Methanocorpusculum petauri]